MGLFNFGKKKKEEDPKVEQTACDCDGACDPGTAQAQSTQGTNEGASVKVLGSGCKKCDDLEAATKEALASLGMDTVVEHVRDFAQIASYGVMNTPALVVDGKVVSMGKVLKTSEVVTILKKARG